MDSANQANAKGDIWECHKAEIGRLYERMALRAVKEHMEKDCQFPVYSPSMWKKKVGRWGFDNKYNKRSTIEAAAAHFQKATRDTTLVPFETLGGKIVSEAELQRYLKRSKMVFRNGKLEPERDSGSSGTVPSHRRPALAVDKRVQQIQRELEKNEEGPVENIHDTQVQMRTKTQQASISEKWAILQYQRQVRRIKISYLFGQGYVRAADLMIPKSSAHHHAVLKGVKESIRSSSAAGRWSVDRDGFFKAPNRNVGNAMAFFGHGYLEAAELYAQGSLLRSRRLLWKALDCLLLGIRFMLPKAIVELFDEIRTIAERLSLEIAQIFIKLTADRIGKDLDIYPGICQLFSSLVAIPSESLLYVLDQAYQVWSESFVINENRTLWSIKVNAWRIQYDSSQSWKEKFDSLWLYWSSLLSDPGTHHSVIYPCFSSMIEASAMFEITDIAKDRLTMGWEYIQSQNIPLENVSAEIQALLSVARMFIYWINDHVSDCIAEAVAAYRISDESDLKSKLALLDILASLYAEYDQDKSGKARAEYMDMMDNLASLRFDDASFNEETPGNELVSPGSRDGYTSICNDMDTVTPKGEVDIDHVWQRYIDGEDYEMKGMKHNQSMW